MGMFDTFLWTCSECGYKNETQSKGGPCELKVFTLEDVPLEVVECASDIPGTLYCTGCSSVFRVHVNVSLVKDEKED